MAEILTEALEVAAAPAFLNKAEAKNWEQKPEERIEILEGRFEKLVPSKKRPLFMALVKQIVEPKYLHGLEKPLAQGKEKTRELAPRQVSAMRALAINRAAFQDMLKVLRNQFPTRELYKSSDRRFMKAYIPPDLESSYTKLVSPREEDIQKHVLSGKTPGTKHKALMSLLETITKAEEILQLRKELKDREKEQGQRAEQEQLEEEVNARQASMSQRLKAVREAIVSTVSPTQEEPIYFDAVETLEQKQQLLALMGNKAQLDYYYKTCFDKGALESLTQGRLREYLTNKPEKLQEIIEHPELLPQEEDPVAFQRAMETLRVREQMMLRTYKATLEVIEKREQLEHAFLGEQELEDRRRLDEAQIENTQTISYGKFIEKVMLLVLAEHCKGKRDCKVIPVSDTIDVRGGIDLMLEIKSPSQPSGKALKGIDVTTALKNQEYEYTKSERETSRPLHLTWESARVVLDQRLLDEMGATLRRQEPISVPRTVMNTPLHTDFRDQLITALYQRLSRASQKEIKDGIEAAKRGQKGFLAKVYEEVAQEFIHFRFKRPLSLSEIYAYTEEEPRA